MANSRHEDRPMPDEDAIGSCSESESVRQLEQWGHGGRGNDIPTTDDLRKKAMGSDKGREHETVPAQQSRQTAKGHEKIKIKT